MSDISIDKIKEDYANGTLKDINPNTPSYNKIDIKNDDLNVINWKLQQQSQEISYDKKDGWTYSVPTEGNNHLASIPTVVGNAGSFEVIDVSSYSIEDIETAIANGTLGNINGNTISANRIDFKNDSIEQIKDKLNTQQEEIAYQKAEEQSNTNTSSNEKGSATASNESTEGTKPSEPVTKDTGYNTNATVSGNATYGRTLKRMKLEYGGKAINFAVNPDDYSQKEPNRVNMTQTKGGAWIDAWGKGIVEISIKGITGVGKTIDTGYQRWKELRNLFLDVYNAVNDGGEIGDEGLIRFYNFTDNEFFYCYPMPSGIELVRSKSKPHIYQYTIALWGLRRIGEPEKVVGTVGNPETKTTTSTETKTSTKTDKDTSATVTTSASKESLKESSGDVADALGPLVAGVNGKLHPNPAYYVVNTIDLTSGGISGNIAIDSDILSGGVFV